MAYPEDLWPLAMHHPWQMYVGPVVERQKQLWKKTREGNTGASGVFEDLLLASAEPVVHT